LAAGRQVICITHLPQIASLGDRHFSIAKDTSVEPARTTVSELGEREVVGELVRMLGADGDDLAARRHAQELRKAA
jgi:DNA repair protein RecN (Recombination protein N)